MVQSDAGADRKRRCGGHWLGKFHCGFAGGRPTMVRRVPTGCGGERSGALDSRVSDGTVAGGIDPTGDSPEVLIVVLECRPR
jgi:hypothetical protein